MVVLFAEQLLNRLRFRGGVEEVSRGFRIGRRMHERPSGAMDVEDWTDTFALGPLAEIDT